VSAAVIRTVPNLTRKVCDPIERVDITAHTAGIAFKMLHTMYRADAQCLAAPQIDVTLRLVVMDVGWKSGAPQPLVLINPEIADRSEETEVGEETCLSIPGQRFDVRRHSRIDLRWQVFEGFQLEGRMMGKTAVLLQHALDHLDGRCCDQMDRNP